MAELISPYGGTVVENYLEEEELRELEGRQDSISVISVPGKLVYDLELLAHGAYSPLSGFFSEEEYRSVVERNALLGGLPWTIPVVLPVSEETKQSLSRKEPAILSDESGEVLGIIEVSDIFPYDREKEARSVYGTRDRRHPGVSSLFSQGPYYVGGRVKVRRDSLSREFSDLRLTPRKTREEFEKRGWEKIVAFQTRNPVHRAHEYIQKVALEVCDGLLLHPVVGETKSDDIPADIRIACYRTLLIHYFPAKRILLSVLPLSMRYAGPKEAIHHGIIRRNYGCSHFIVGRDHAGVGAYYGTYDAQKIFEEFDRDLLGITPLFFEHSFYCRDCHGMASFKTCPHDSSSRLILSGTKVREMLEKGITPPPEFTRKEVAEILIHSFARSA